MRKGGEQYRDGSSDPVLGVRSEKAAQRGGHGGRIQGQASAHSVQDKQRGTCGWIVVSKGKCGRR